MFWRSGSTLGFLWPGPVDYCSLVADAQRLVSFHPKGIYLVYSERTLQHKLKYHRYGQSDPFQKQTLGPSRILIAGRFNQVERNLRRSLVHPPVQSRICSEFRWGR